MRTAASEASPICCVIPTSSQRSAASCSMAAMPSCAARSPAASCCARPARPSACVRTCPPCCCGSWKARAGRTCPIRSPCLTCTSTGVASSSRGAGPPSAATPHASRAPHAAAGRPGPGRSPAAGPEGARRRPPGARLDRVLRLAVRAAPLRAGTAPRPTPPTLCPARARGRRCPPPSDRRGPAALPQGPAPPSGPRPSGARHGGPAGPDRPGSEPAAPRLRANPVRHTGPIAPSLRRAGPPGIHRSAPLAAQEPRCGTTPTESGVGRGRPTVPASEPRKPPPKATKATGL